MTPKEQENKQTDTELREELADIQHEIWSHWMEYLFSVSKDLGEHGTFIPPEYGDRWGRQMNQRYSELSEKEKQSDRNQVDKFWHLIQKALHQREQQLKAELLEKVEEIVVRSDYTRNEKVRFWHGVEEVKTIINNIFNHGHN